MKPRIFPHFSGTPSWVSEIGQGYGMTVKATRQLCHEKTTYQTIDIYETERLGRMLLLDGIIQLTEADEFAYSEMLAHVPLMACIEPERVLVIGGGDGAVLREVEKHRSLKVIDQCELDAQVIEACKRYLPQQACSYQDARLNVHIGDGSKYIRDFQDYYDVIIVDSTDPGGPGEPLFGKDFYRAMRRALRNGGVIATQAESPYLLPDMVRHLVTSTREVFDEAGYAMITVPSYPTGTIGVCCGGVGVNPATPNRQGNKAMLETLRYYSKELHRAAFVLPQFVNALLA